MSNVVNGTFPVSPETRERVEQALVELDYVPNLSARGLRNGRTGVVALALPDLETSYSAEVAHHFVVAARQRGLNVQIEETAADHREHELLSRARAQLVDGLILNPVLLETSAVQRGRLAASGRADRRGGPTPRRPRLARQRRGQPRDDHDVDRGRGTAGSLRSASWSPRPPDCAMQGYRQAMAEAGLEPSTRAEHRDRTGTRAGGGGGDASAICEEHRTARCHLLLHRRDGDRSADCALGRGLPGAGRRLGGRLRRRRRRRVPVPPLTTVRVRQAELAETALDLLVQRIADPSARSAASWCRTDRRAAPELRARAA